MKIKSTLLLLLVFFLAVGSCKETEEPDLPLLTDDPVLQDPAKDIPTIDLKVILPNGVNVDLSKATLLTGFISYPVSNNGDTKAKINSGTTRITHLLDEQGDVVMMGFVNAQNKEISLESTAQVVAYYSSGVVYGLEDLDVRFFKDFESLPGFDNLKQAIFSGMKGNPKFLASPGLRSSIEIFLDELNVEGDLVDIRARQINVDPTGFKSGIQIFEENFQNIQITNRFRRRTHAFIYKTSFKNKEGIETVLIPRVGGSDKAEKDLLLTPTLGIQSFVGVLSDWASGNGMAFAATTTESIPIPLGPSESEATYKVRIVGPGLLDYPNMMMTDDELAKWNRLMIETFTLDYLVPVISKLLGHNKSAMSQSFGKFITIIEGIISVEPVLKDLIEKGEFQIALKGFLNVLFTKKSGEWDKMVTAMMEGVANFNTATDPNYFKETTEQITEKTESLLKVMKVVDNFMFAADISRSAGQIALSNSLEEFTAKALEHDIILSPKEASVTNFAAEELTVHTKTELGDGQAFLYKWSTSGKYGHLRDNLGNKGTEIENGQKTISYKAETSVANLPDNAIEIITVTAYVKQGQNLTKIGEAQASIAVKPARLEVKPNNVTLMGEQKIKLYIEWANGDPFYITDDPFDYKFEWSTPAVYGNFEGGVNTVTTTVPYITYQALDREVEKASETISVQAYIKSKDSDRWIRYDDITGNVNIENDENIKILHVMLHAVSLPNPCDGCFTNWLQATFPKEDNHESYTVRFYGFKKQAIPSVEGKTYSWKADQEVPRSIDFSRHTNIPENRIGVWILNNSGGKGHNPNLLNKLREFGGMVEVKIKLKPE
ncbi:hypothetical protein [Aquiflexum lacus]|uniref:hypothetical protein n=1 Tax=Aquiflexum lacus TaxID=2483805 RepID=UPI001895B9A0|nr:hypothetical protein [Aquiflexum lacus]